MEHIVVFGPGPQFKGGLANYTLSLAKTIDAMGKYKVTIVSWTNQYPAIVPRDFIDRSTKENKLAGTGVEVVYVTNYNNPFSWTETVRTIANLKPSKVIFQWSIAIQGLPLGVIARRLKKACEAEILFDLHFVIQKEQSLIDARFTKWGIRSADTYVVHALQTARELEEIFPDKKFEITTTGQRSTTGKTTVIKLFHPVYNMFKIHPEFDVEAYKQSVGLKKHVFLFFGFIRKYKGLHFCLEAFKEVAARRNDVSLLIVGESFWQTLDQTKLSTKIKNLIFKTVKSLLVRQTDNEQNYNPLAMIDQFGLQDKVMLVNDFVPNEDVYKYFQSSDSILLFYEYATPSGVESMAYNFNLPILATRVGHFPETVIEGFNGYLADAANTSSMAAVMLKSIEKPIDRNNVAVSASAQSWEAYAEAILK
jgi:glycosyltransferase involved in cell wall biosynthesis